MFPNCASFDIINRFNIAIRKSKAITTNHLEIEMWALSKIETRKRDVVLVPASCEHSHILILIS